MAKDLKRGRLVWAKMKGFPPWPAKIAFPKDGKVPKSKKPQHYVHFFGTHDFAWILDQFVFLHSEEMLANAKQYKKKSSTMQAAILEIEKAGQKCPKKSLAKEKSKKEPAAAALSPFLPPPYTSLPPEETPEKSPPKTRKKKPVAKKKVKVERKTPKKRSASAMLNDPEDEDNVGVKEDDSDVDYTLLMANCPPYNGLYTVAVIPPYNDESNPNSMYMNGMNAPLDSDSTTGCRTEKIKGDIFGATSKTIGFLGLGVMGCAMVKRLLTTGHKVTIWNRSVLDNYTDFVEAGAKLAKNPADVIQACDITLCCVSDVEASKNVVFGNQGVLAGFEGLCSNKAYIEMSSIDPVTSQEIAEAIAGKGGRYLEAPMIGKRQDVSTRSLVILTAGHRGVFADCNTVFASFAKHAFFLNCDVGYANKMRLVLSMLAGTAFAALAESIAIIEKTKVDPAFFLEVVGSGPANCPLLLEKGRAMITNDDTVYTPINHQQKDLAMALELGNACQQPLALAVAANEVFKRGMRKDENSDVSAICKWLK